ncbi:MAG: PAS domain S-box protein [Gammaproteobacteria bacterium]
MNTRLHSFNLSLLLPLSALLIFAVLLTSIVFLGYRNTQELTRLQERQNIVIGIKQLQLRIELSLSNNDILNLEREFSYHDLNPQLDIAVLIDDHGRVVAASRQEWKNRPARELFTDYNPDYARQSQTDLKIGLYSNDDNTTHFVYAPVFLGGTPDKKLRSYRLGVIYASYNSNDFESRLWEHTIHQGVWIWICTLLALGALYAIQQWSVAKPLKRLKSYAAKIGSGDFSLSNPLQGRGELYELGCVLEQTSHKLSTTLSMLERREQKLSVTLQSIGDALIATDTAGVVTRMNNRAEQLTGWTVVEAVGKPLAEIFHITHAETGFALDSPVEKVLKTRQIVLQGNQTVLCSRDGSHYHINNNAAPILDENANLYGVVLVFADITEKYRLKEQLKREKEHLQHVLDNSVAAIYTLKPIRQGQGGFEFKYGNKTLEKISGYAISDWIHRPNFWFSKIHPDDRDQAELNSQKVLTEGQIVHSYRFLNAQNDYRWIRDHLTVHRDKDGNITEIVGIWLDITHEKQVALKNQQLGDILERSHNEIYLFDARTFRYVQVNEGARKNLGYDLDELYDMTPLDITPDIDTKAFLALIEPLTQQTRPHIVFETVHQRKNHTLYPVEINLQLYNDPEHPLFCAIVQDTTERHATEHALTEAHQKLQNILAASPSVIYTCSTGGDYACNFISDNIRQLLGYTAEEFLTDSKLKRENIHPDDTFLTVSDQLPLKHNHHYRQTYRFRHKNGHFVWLQDELIALTDQNDKPVELIGSLTDINALKLTEKQLSDERSLLANLVNNIPDLIFAKDPDGIYLLCNKAFENYLGRSTTDILGHDDFDFVDPEMAQFFRKHDAITLSRDRPHANEEWITYPDGQKICIEMLKTPFKDENGTLLGLIGIGRNITERKIYETKKLHVSDLKSSLSIISQAINHIKNETDLFSALCRILVDQSALTSAWIGLFDEKGQRLKPVSEQSKALPDKNGLPEIVAQTQSQALSAFQDNRLVRSTPPVGTYAQTACVSVPIVFNRRPYAVLTVCTELTDYFDDDINLLLKGLTDELGYALEMYAFTALQKTIQEKLELSAKVFEQSLEGIMICDLHNRIISVNQAFTTITGYQEREVQGKDPKLLSSGLQDKDFYRNLWESLKTSGFWQGEIWNRTKLGEIYPEWLTISVIYDKNGEVTNYIGIFSDLSQHKEAEQRIEHMAHYDPLTDLPNRILLKARIDHEIAVAKRHNLSLAILFIDLDHFKYINDSLGHTVGDKLLIEIGHRLLSAVREEDTVARLGGDEFTVQLCDTDEIGAAAVAKKIITSLSSPIYIAGNQLHVTPSIGISLFPDNGLDYDSLTQNADTAMYHAKRQGRNQYQFFTTEMQEQSHRRLVVENDLRQALKRNELALYFQPQIAADTFEIIGAEVLLRWNHEQWGLVSPAEFIPIAEECGLILQIGDWVLEQAIVQAKRWQTAGYPPLTIAVNLSLAQFRDEKLYEKIKTLLEHYHLDPQFLELELTESVAMHNVESAIGITWKLKQLGILLSIDDFGTGYSSLSYLQRFALHKLKIDQSFSRKMLESQESENIVDAIISLAKSLKLKTIAEGVETEQQLNMLKEKNCDEIQGFYFSKPVPADQFEALLKRRRL